MEYDLDKTAEVLGELKEFVAAGRIKAAMRLLRHADAGGTLRSDPGVVAGLKVTVGEDHTTELIRAFAGEACPYCTAGREKCEDCGGKGYYAGVKVCKPCAGLGLRRCPFCNGTSLVGYDFVPRGLRPAVMATRLSFAKGLLGALLKAKEPDEGTRSIARRILEVDRCRGILANSVEQARLNEVGAAGTRPLYSSEQRMGVEREARQLNAKAEGAIRKLLGALAEGYARKAEGVRTPGDARTLHAHRAKVFAKLGSAQDFGESALRTPRSLRAD